MLKTARPPPGPKSAIRSLIWLRFLAGEERSWGAEIERPKTVLGVVGRNADLRLGLRIAGLGIVFDRRSLLFERLFKGFARESDVLTKQLAGRRDLAIAAQFEDMVMLFVGALHPVSEVKLQAGVALTAVIDVADDRHESWLIAARVEDGMKLPEIGRASCRERVLRLV